MQASMEGSNDERSGMRGVRVGSPAVSVRGLTKRFGDVIAVEDLTFEVQPGRVTGFLGPNGAGKSTTLRMILGLVGPSTGTASVVGMPYRDLESPARTVGAVLETQSFNPLRTGRNHLRVLAAAEGIDDDRVDAVLDLVDLSAAGNRKAGKYSLGMRQRLALAGALLGEPSILILTSQPTASTRSGSGGCVISSSASRPEATRCSSRAISPGRWSRWPTRPS